MMAKIPFSKLGIKPNNEIVILPWENYNIEIRKYLPMVEKATLISNVINLSADDNGYYNPLKIKVYLTLEVMFAYTNLTFTSKMREEALKTYDIVIGSGLFEQVIKCMPQEEWDELQNMVWHTISNIYEYKNSVMGVLESVQDNYQNMDLDATNIQEKLNNPEGLELLKTVLEKMG